MDLEEEAFLANPRAGLFMAFKKGVAEATLATRNEWREAMRIESGGRLISRPVFERWCLLMGRKTP